MIEMGEREMFGLHFDWVLSQWAIAEFAGDLAVAVQLGQHRLDVLHTVHLGNVCLCVCVRVRSRVFGQAGRPKGWSARAVPNNYWAVDNTRAL